MNSNTDKTHGLAIATALAAALTSLAVPLGVTGCGGQTGTLVFVTVEARPTVRQSADLVVTLSNEGSDLTESFDIEDASFPVTFTVSADGREGDLTVTVNALDDDGGALAVGSGSATLELDRRVDLDVVLEPNDFLVNTSIAGRQQTEFAFDRNSRQIAVAPDDSFVITFLNDCAMLGRCDILARIFGPDSTPLVNDVTRNDAEFIVNLQNQFTQVPSVVIGPGGTLFTWGTEDQIRAALMTETGGHLLQEDITVSLSPLPSIDPRATALPNGEFVVVWLDCSTAGCAADAANVMTVRARFFDSQGNPVANPVDGTTGAFDVSSVDEQFVEVPTIVATGTGREFVAVWPTIVNPASSFPDTVRARFFDPEGAPRQANHTTLIASAGPGTFVYGSQVAMVSSGNELAVVWGVGREDGANLVDGRLLYRRFSPVDGTPVSDLATLVENTANVFAAPGLAVRGDGAMAIAWHNDSGPGDDSDFGVFVQVFRTSGLRVGQPFSAPTTTLGTQALPAIAATSDAFVVTWTDDSEQPPDTDQSGVRARVVYPPFDEPNGGRGQPCGGTDDAACGAGLVCIEDFKGELYCHEECDPGAQVTCPTGGTCIEEGGLAGCVF